MAATAGARGLLRKESSCLGDIFGGPTCSTMTALRKKPPLAKSVKPTAILGLRCMPLLFETDNPMLY